MDDLISRAAVKKSLVAEYNRKRTGDGLRLAWIEKAIDDTPPEQQWIPIHDGEGQLPEVNAEGYSDYVLISFANFAVPAVGQYFEDENGGAFHLGDEEDPVARYGVIVNGWMPLPKCLEE